MKIESRIKAAAMNAMKRKAPAIDSMYKQEAILPSRSQDVTSMVSTIKSQFMTPRSVVVTGMKETGKSTKAQAVVEGLKQAGIPAVYIQVDKDNGDTFFVGALRAFGIFDEIADEFATSVKWGDIAGLIRNTCYEFEEGNVIVLDNVSKKSPFLQNIESISRSLSENHPSTVVVIVTFDATDMFWLKHGMFFSLACFVLECLMYFFIFFVFT